MKSKIFTTAAIICITAFSSFYSFANQNDLIDSGHEKAEIAALESEVIARINESGPRSELSRDVTENDIDFDAAYKVFSNSELFKERTTDAFEIKQLLQNGHYIWQMPVLVENDTVLVDFYKNAEIRDDLPDDVKENLQETLNEWQVGAIYVYDDRTVDFSNTLRTSLTSVSLDINDYTYEFVSGLPGIRYPVAVVFDSQEAKYIVPAELEAARAFGEDSKKMEYTAAGPSTSTSDIQINDDLGFPVYNFNDVSKASRSSSSLGLGGNIGLAPQRNPAIIIGMVIIVTAGVCFIIARLFKKH